LSCPQLETDGAERLHPAVPDEGLRVDRPVADDALLVRGGRAEIIGQFGHTSSGRSFGEDRAVLDRHHLDEVLHGLLPPREETPGERGARELVVALDQHAHLLPVLLVDFEVGRLAVDRGPVARTVVRLYRRTPATLARR
jgi:hypothetical protein